MRERRRQFASSRYRRSFFVSAVAGAAVILALTPFRLDAALDFEFMQTGVERALPDLKHIFGALADLPGDGPAVHGAGRERLENQQVESALDEVGGFTHLYSPRPGRIYPTPGVWLLTR
jgi:hypothetical protein